MKYVAVMVCILWGLLDKGQGQGQQNPVGLYNDRGTSGDGLGGSTLAILDDGTFAAAAFGTLVTGHWAIDKKNQLLTLYPLNPEAPFAVYGRENPEITEGMRLIYTRDGDDDVYIGQYPEAMKRLFNEGANCFLFPNIHVEKTIPPEISAADISGNGDGMPIPGQELVYTFSTAGYNEFLLEYYQPSMFHQPMRYALAADGIRPLDAWRNETLKREPLPADGEDAEFLRQAPARHKQAFQADYRLMNTDFLVFNDLFTPNLSLYQLDGERNVYLRKQNDRAFDNYARADTLYRFEKIIADTRPLEKFEPLAGSLFRATCDDEMRTEEPGVHGW